MVLLSICLDTARARQVTWWPCPAAWTSAPAPPLAHTPVPHCGPTASAVTRLLSCWLRSPQRVSKPAEEKFHLLPLQRWQLLGKAPGAEKGVKGCAPALWAWGLWKRSRGTGISPVMWYRQSQPRTTQTSKILHESNVTLPFFHLSRLQNDPGYIFPFILSSLPS